MTTVVESRLEAYLEQSTGYDNLKTDVVTKAGQIRLDETAEILFPRDIFGRLEPRPMSDWALQQMCNRLGPPPFKYMRECPEDLRATNLNHWLNAYPPDKNWLLRVYDDHVRAVLSDQYTPVSNTDMLQAVVDYAGLADLADYKLTRPYLTPDDMYMRVSTMRTKDGSYETGFFLYNSEIGRRRVGVSGYLKRDICDNCMLLIDGGFSHQHRWQNKEWFAVQIRHAIAAAMQLSGEALEQIALAEMHEIPQFADVVERVTKAFNLSPLGRDNILMGSENQRTRMGIVNGLSYAAHVTEGLTEHQRVDMEAAAGTLLVQSSVPHALSELRAMQPAELED